MYPFTPPNQIVVDLPLVAGRPLIARVVARARASREARVIVAADTDAILEGARQCDVEAVWTPP